MKTQFYTPETLELLKKQMDLAPSTAHKLWNPLCAQCAMERRKQFIQDHKTT